MHLGVPSAPTAEFDRYAEDYDAALGRGLRASGEGKEYFAAGRARWLARCLEALAETPRAVLDFGCGTGAATPYLAALPSAPSVLGVDVSAGLLRTAARDYASSAVQFRLRDGYQPDASIDLAYCNGVFHHIPPVERAAAVAYVRDSLRSGGLFAMWENNPWNPGTRYVMSRIPFDRDAITLSAPEARRLVTAGGFEVLRTDFLFIFPRMLRRLRGLEPFLSGVPLGAQYQILCRKR